MEYICYRDICHTAVILDAAHGNAQQPAHNLVAVSSPLLCGCYAIECIIF